MTKFSLRTLGVSVTLQHKVSPSLFLINCPHALEGATWKVIINFMPGQLVYRHYGKGGALPPPPGLDG